MADFQRAWQISGAAEPTARFTILRHPRRRTARAHSERLRAQTALPPNLCSLDRAATARATGSPGAGPGDHGVAAHRDAGAPHSGYGRRRVPRQMQIRIWARMLERGPAAAALQVPLMQGGGCSGRDAASAGARADGGRLRSPRGRSASLRTQIPPRGRSSGRPVLREILVSERRPEAYVSDARRTHARAHARMDTQTRARDWCARIPPTRLHPLVWNHSQYSSPI